MLPILILLQATSLADAAGFDLRTLQSPTPACGSSHGGDIVVCARSRKSTARTAADDREPEAILPRAEFGIIEKLRTSIDTEAVSINSFPSNRIMVRTKVPF